MSDDIVTAQKNKNITIQIKYIYIYTITNKVSFNDEIFKNCQCRSHIVYLNCVGATQVLCVFISIFICRLD